MTQRRGHNEGTIFKRDGKVRKDGTRATMYVSELVFEGPDGHKRRKTLYGKTRREVQQKLEEAKLARIQSMLTVSGRQSVEIYLTEWLEAIRNSLRPSTVTNYALAIKWLARHLGGRRIDQLRARHIEICYMRLQDDGLSGRSVQIAHSVLRPALRRAVQQGLIPFNPADIVKPPRSTKTEMQTLTLEQVKSFLASTENDPLGPLYVVLASTGLRIGEALGLKWSDINLSEGTVTVQRTVQRITGQGIVAGEPKSSSSRRNVYLVDAATEALTAHRRQQTDRCLVMGDAWQDNDIVFASANGTFLDPTNVHHRFERALVAVGLPTLPLHSLRHTAATLALQQGIHPKIVQDMLGHSTYTLTMNTYSHVTPSLHRQAMRTMSEVFDVPLRDRSKGDP